MATRLESLCFDANDPARLASFWASALGWSLGDNPHGELNAVPTDGTRFSFTFLAVVEPKTAKNPIHLHLVAESVVDQQQVVARLIELGAQHVDVGQAPDADHVVLADPEGNEFCVILRGEFFSDASFLTDVAFDPAHPATGYFWGQAIGWPVVYDQDGDVAIRAPDLHGPFLTFGPPGTAKSGKNRLHLHLVPDAGTDQASEVDRLLALGATQVDIGQGHSPRVVLADPDGNEFCVFRRSVDEVLSPPTSAF